MLKYLRHVIPLVLLVFASCAGSDSTKGSVTIPTDLKTELRAPAYPLVTIDPYFNGWSMTNNLYDDQVRHWTEKEFPLVGAIRVDGEVYRFMGVEKLPLTPILPTVHEEKWEGKYTFNQPKDGWESLTYDDSNWQTGASAFGTKNEPNLSTLWETKDIWIRRVFNLDEDLNGKEIFLHYSHDDIFELYINGERVIDTGYTWKYDIQEKLADNIVSKLKQGENIIAVHCHNRTGGAYVDFGLYENQPDKSMFTKTATQTSASVLPTQTVYKFDCGNVEMDLIFTSPLLMDDLDLMSRPISYISYQVRSKDDKEHDVQIYFEATPHWAINETNQQVDYEILESNGMKFLKTGTVEQPILQKKGDDIRIDWGYFYIAAPNGKNSTMNFSNYWDSKTEFGKDGKIALDKKENLSAKMSEELTVLAYSEDMGKVLDDKAGYFMLGYDDVYSIQYFEENYKGYWAKNGDVSIIDAFKMARDDYSSIMERCDKFNRELMNDAYKAGGTKYMELCALVYRQVVSAHKLIEDKEGTLLFLSKENNSNGSIGTVDISYPSSPLFLVYNTELAKGLMNHIIYYSESGKWTKPFPAHDIGTYPIGNGLTYGGDMPIEESGNMLIMAGAIATMEGNAEYAKKHWDLLTTWTNYMVEHGLDPENQLCTDDFAGHLAHNTNLSIKAIMGIASYSKLADMLGYKDTADKYFKIASEMAVKWEKMANDKDHYRLAFDKPGTWSMKYNLVWDKLLGFNIFNPAIATTELAYYRTKNNKYGLPLDNRADYTKTDWMMWTAILTGEKDDFDFLVDMVYKYADETVSRVPISDWHNTITTERMNFKARSVVGGYYIKMLEDKIKGLQKQ